MLREVQVFNLSHGRQKMLNLLCKLLNSINFNFNYDEFLIKMILLYYDNLLCVAILMQWCSIDACLKIYILQLWYSYRSQLQPDYLAGNQNRTQIPVLVNQSHNRFITRIWPIFKIYHVCLKCLFSHNEQFLMKSILER